VFQFRYLPIVVNASFHVPYVEPLPGNQDNGGLVVNQSRKAIPRGRFALRNDQCIHSRRRLILKWGRTRVTMWSRYRFSQYYRLYNSQLIYINRGVMSFMWRNISRHFRSYLPFIRLSQPCPYKEPQLLAL